MHVLDNLQGSRIRNTDRLLSFASHRLLGDNVEQSRIVMMLLTVIQDVI